MSKYILLLIIMASSFSITATSAGEDKEDYKWKWLHDSKDKELAETKKIGNSFLAKNKIRDNVITLPSGLQYLIINKGTGRKPTLTDQVETHYLGRLINGKLFESSYYRGKPVTFPVKGVIKGWTEALLLMKEGAKWKLFIPSELAYGDRGAGGKIPPGSTLIFEVELLSIK